MSKHNPLLPFLSIMAATGFDHDTPVLPPLPAKKPYDPEAATRLQAERAVRKAANYRKRYNLPLERKEE